MTALRFSYLLSALRLSLWMPMLLALLALLSACAPLVVGGVAGGTALVATDRRTTGTQVEDANIGLKVGNQMRRNLGETSRVETTVYLGRLLLTGEVPDQASKERAAQLAVEVENVKDVVNQLRIAPVASFDEQASDAWTTAKVRAALINTRGVPSRTIVVTTSNGVVYLMGRLTRAESDMAATVAAGVGGVKRVVKVFNLMTPQEAAALNQAQPAAAPAAPSKPAPIDTIPAATPTNAPTPGVEVIPVE